MESHEAGALLRPAGHQRNSRHASTLGVTLSASERWVHYGFFCALRGLVHLVAVQGTQPQSRGAWGDRGSHQCDAGLQEDGDGS